MSVTLKAKRSCGKTEDLPHMISNHIDYYNFLESNYKLAMLSRTPPKKRTSKMLCSLTQ
jgi:hypothetical protein